MNTMYPKILLPALCALLMAGCTGKKTESHQSAGKDSSSTTDSTVSQSTASNRPLLSYEQRQGKALYGKYCTICHGEEGKGDGFNAYNLDPKPRDFTDPKLMEALTDERMAQTISGGGRSVNKSAEMPSWDGRLSKQEIQYVVEYVKMLGKQHPDAGSH